MFGTVGNNWNMTHLFETPVASILDLPVRGPIQSENESLTTTTTKT